MATRDLGRLGKRVKAHRLELYPSRVAAAKAAGGMSKDTWKRVEDGLEVREGTYAKVEKALSWARESCEAVAEGGEPVLVDQSKAPASTPAATLPSADAVRRAAFEAGQTTLPPSVQIGHLDAFADKMLEVLRRASEVRDGS